MNERFETFTVMINRISRNIRKIKNQEMAEYNLRSSHISCLYYLYISFSFATLILLVPDVIVILLKCNVKKEIFLLEMK